MCAPPGIVMEHLRRGTAQCHFDGLQRVAILRFVRSEIRSGTGALPTSEVAGWCERGGQHLRAIQSMRWIFTQFGASVNTLNPRSKIRGYHQSDPIRCLRSGVPCVGGQAGGDRTPRGYLRHWTKPAQGKSKPFRVGDPASKIVAQQGKTRSIKTGACLRTVHVR
jgi:hypothetical protein